MHPGRDALPNLWFYRTKLCWAQGDRKSTNLRSSVVHVAFLNLILFLGTHLGSGNNTIKPIAGIAVHPPKASPSYLWFDRTKTCAQRKTTGAPTCAVSWFDYVAFLDDFVSQKSS